MITAHQKDNLYKLVYNHPEICKVTDKIADTINSGFRKNDQVYVSKDYFKWANTFAGKYNTDRFDRVWADILCLVGGLLKNTKYENIYRQDGTAKK